MIKKIFFVLLAIVLIFGFMGCTSPPTPPFYSAIFNLEGGHISGRPQSLKFSASHGNELSTFPDNPQKEYYIFGGWFTARNGFGNEISRETRLFSDLTVYARWIPE